MSIILFDKIEAKTPVFQSYSKKYESILIEFQNYAQNENREKVLSGKKSGKSNSYKLYLVRLLIFIELDNKTATNKEDLAEIYFLIDKLRQKPGYKKYNDREGGFPNACIEMFKRYTLFVLSLYDRKISLGFNEYLNESFTMVRSGGAIAQKRIIYTPIDRSKESIFFNRSEVESKEAKIRSNWLCEWNPDHKTFTSKNGKPYVEAHHLVPMYAQKLFEYKLDFADNIVTLCPTCHKKIHNSIEEEREEMIRNIYRKRSQKLFKFGIEITENQLIDLYKI